MGGLGGGQTWHQDSLTNTSTCGWGSKTDEEVAPFQQGFLGDTLAPQLLGLGGSGVMGGLGVTMWPSFLWSDGRPGWGWGEQICSL